MRLSVFFLLSLTVLLGGCSGDENQLTITSQNFGEEILEQQNLEITFDRDVAPTQILGEWTDTPFLEIEPEVSGMFRWENPRTLVFSPESGFAPSTEYEARLTEAITEMARDKNTELPEETELKFHTPYLTLLGAQAFWGGSAENDAQVEMALNFNYAIDPAQLKNLISINIGDYDVGYVIEETGAGRTIRLVVQHENVTELAKEKIRVSIRSGLRLANPNSFGAKELAAETSVPSIDRFEITEVQDLQSTTQPYVKVITNQALRMSAEEIKNRVTVRQRTGTVPVGSSFRFEVEKLDFGFIIKGNFLKSEEYEMVINKNIQSIFGKSLSDDYEHKIVFGNVKPSIQFSESKATYLTSKGKQHVGIRIVQLEKVKVEVIKIYQNNLIHFLRDAAGLYDYGGQVGSYYSQYNEFGDLIYDKEVPTESLSESGDLRLLDLQQLTSFDRKPFQGVYLVRVASPEQRWTSDSRLVCVSDIGFIAKESDDEIVVFLNSILTGAPVSDAVVSFISKNNQEVFAAKTDAEGIARFSEMSKKAPDFDVQMITASKGGEFSYMHFRQNRVQHDSDEIDGIRSSKNGYQAFIYGPRNLYRPGETMAFKTIVQDFRWKPVADMLIKFKIKLPNGKTFLTRKGELNTNGTFETEIKLPDNAVTGSYTAEVYTSNDKLLGAYNVNVEEFIPDRIKVTSQVSSERIRSGETFRLSGTAVNLFGPPAAGRDYEVEFSLNNTNFHPAPKDPTYGDFDFALQGNSGGVRGSTLFREGKTDAQGQFMEEITAPPAENVGVLRGTAYTTVFDETGRPVSDQANFQVFTQEVFIGLKPLETYWLSTQQPINFPIAALDKDGKAASTEARIVVEREEWQSVLEKDYSGNYRYVSKRKTLTEEETTLNLSGRGQFTFVPERSGRHIVKVSLPNAKPYVAMRFYAYGYGATASSFQVDKEGQVKMVLDKDEYKVGDKAKVLFKTPFSGRMLVTIERDKLIQHRYLEVQEKSAAMEFDITEEHLPNVYVTATLLKPIRDTDLPLTVAHGVKQIKTTSEDYEISIELDAPKSSRSRREQTVKIKTVPNAELTIAAVDEGILQIKRYETPDPFAYFFQPRALQVSSCDVYPRLFPELSIRKDSYGAGGYDLSGRTNPMTNKRIKPVSFWSKTIRTDGSGRAEYTFEIPEFSGDIRIMALAVRGSQTGSAATNMKVADPLVVSAGVPRFLSPGDEAEIPVTLSNTTDKTAEASVRLSLSGQLSAAETSQSVSIPPNAERRVTFRVDAEKTIGTGTLKFEVDALGETFPSTTELTIRPSTSLLKESSSGMVEGGSSREVSFANDFIPKSVEARLIVSKSPMVEFADDLNHLVRYPYGCVEQTVSAAFPQLYLADLTQTLGKTLDESQNPDENVRAAIAKLQTMQRYDGGLNYWQGGTYASWWGSVYAANFLMEAQKAGFEVSEEFMENLYNYLSQQVRRKSTNDYYYYDASGKRVVKKIAPKSVFYSLYVLAMAGKKDVATMNYYKANPNLLALDSRYLLAATYKLLGDTQSFNELLPRSFEGEKSVNALGGSFYSYLRDLAISLNMLIETDPNNPQIGTLSRQLSEQMKAARYLNTQERAFGLLALGKVSRQANQSTITAKLTMNGNTLGNFDGKTLVLNRAELSNQRVTIQTSGQGRLYYFQEIEGLSATGDYVEEDKSLKVRKAFFDRNGNPLTSLEFAQNDLIVVRLMLQTTDNLDKVENVVVTDMLPAGFEIENPRLTRSSGLNWIKNAAEPEHYDFRDDRVNLFTTATRKAQAYYYTVRAVSPGRFRMGPVSADAMYNGAYHSYHGADEVVVR